MKRVLGFLLAMAMLLTMVSTSAFASERGQGSGDAPSSSKPKSTKKTATKKGPYTPQEFTEELQFRGYSMRYPKGWIVEASASDETKTFIYDTSKTTKECGIIIAFYKEYGEQMYDTMDEADEMLIDMMKRNKLKDYELMNVNGCPSVRWIDTETIETVKKTYAHGLFVLGQTSSFEFRFSTRNKDKDLQASEFEKLLTSVTAADIPTASYVSFPEVIDLLADGLSIEEIKVKMEELLGKKCKIENSTVQTRSSSDSDWEDHDSIGIVLEKPYDIVFWGEKWNCSYGAIPDIGEASVCYSAGLEANKAKATEWFSVFLREMIKKYGEPQDNRVDSGGDIVELPKQPKGASAEESLGSAFEIARSVSYGWDLGAYYLDLSLNDGSSDESFFNCGITFYPNAK